MKPSKTIKKAFFLDAGDESIFAKVKKPEKRKHYPNLNSSQMPKYQSTCPVQL